MSSKIALRNRAVLPGQTLEGEVVASGKSSSKALSLFLCWRTEGRGTQDSGEEKVLDLASSIDREPQGFIIPAPHGPYSYEGRLLEIIWTVELRRGRKTLCAEEFILSPTLEVLKSRKQGKDSRS